MAHFGFSFRSLPLSSCTCIRYLSFFIFCSSFRNVKGWGLILLTPNRPLSVFPVWISRLSNPAQSPDLPLQVLMFPFILIVYLFTFLRILAKMDADKSQVRDCLIAVDIFLFSVSQGLSQLQCTPYCCQ